MIVERNRAEVNFFLYYFLKCVKRNPNGFLLNNEVILQNFANEREVKACLKYRENFRGLAI